MKRTRLRPKSKKNRATAEEKAHLERVKGLECCYCADEGLRQEAYTEVHHIRRGTEYKKHFATIPLCETHHDELTDSRTAWRDYEEAALRHTLEALYGPERLQEMMERAGR